MIIILEGPRGTGKTTLAHALIDELKVRGRFPMMYKFVRGKDPYSDMMAQLQDFRKKSENRIDVIVDRFHLTEMVMSIAEARERSFSAIQKAQSLDKWLREGGAVGFIIFVPESERLKRTERPFEIPLMLSPGLWDMAHGMSYFHRYWNKKKYKPWTHAQIMLDIAEKI